MVVIGDCMIYSIDFPEKIVERYEMVNSIMLEDCMPHLIVGDFLIFGVSHCYKVMAIQTDSFSNLPAQVFEENYLIDDDMPVESHYSIVLDAMKRLYTTFDEYNRCNVVYFKRV